MRLNVLYRIDMVYGGTSVIILKLHKEHQYFNYPNKTVTTHVIS